MPWPSLAEHRAACSDWARGRWWWVRAPLLLAAGWQLLAWIGDPDRWTVFFGLNLGIHEAGHLLTGFLGTFLCALAGSVFQCAAPVVAAVLFMRQGDYFAVTLCGTWLASNLFYVAWYLADASTMAIPLVSVGGGDVFHDWNTVLDMLGWLGSEGFLSSGLRLLAYSCSLAGVASGAWVLRLMAVSNRKAATKLR
jgi:hypothetical protein